MCLCLPLGKQHRGGLREEDDKLVLLEIKAAAGGLGWGSKERWVQEAAASKGGGSAVVGLWAPRDSGLP